MEVTETKQFPENEYLTEGSLAKVEKFSDARWNSDSDWKNWEEYWKLKHPNCGTCQAGHRHHSELKEHILSVHYVERTLSLYGSGNICGVCKQVNRHSFRTSMNKRRQIVRHMIKHFDVVFAEEVEYLNSHLNKGIDSTSGDINTDSQESTRVVEMQKHTTERALTLEKGSAHAPITDDARYKLNPLWQECEQFFKTSYPNCQNCQKGHDSASSLKIHLTLVHYGNSAIELFGESSKCPICELMVVPESGQQDQTLIIKNHMSLHLENFILGKGKILLQMATEAMSKLDDLHLCQSEPSSTKCLKNKAVKKLEKHQNVQTYPDSNVSKHPLKNGKPLQKKSSTLVMSDPASQECQNYFRNQYPSCDACIRGHKTYQEMKRHMTYNHYPELAVSLFKNSRNCPICQSAIVVPDSKKWQQIYQIKMHMTTHLELFIPDQEARTLLMKVKYKPKSSTSKKNPASQSLNTNSEPSNTLFKIEQDGCFGADTQKYTAKLDSVKQLSEFSKNKRAGNASSFINSENEPSFDHMIHQNASASASALNSAIENRNITALAETLTLSPLNHQHSECVVKTEAPPHAFPILSTDSKKHISCNNIPQLNYFTQFFKEEFPKCKNCCSCSFQRPMDISSMIRHLFIVHYRDKIPGANDKTVSYCQVCHKKDIVPPKLNRSMSRVSYIVRHFMTDHKKYLINSFEDYGIVRCFLALGLTNKCRKIDKIIAANLASKLFQNNTSTKTSSQRPPSGALLNTKETDQLNNEVNENEASSGFVSSKDSLKLEWQDYIKHFKRIYINCLTCQKSRYRIVLDMVEHLIIRHHLEIIPGACDSSNLECKVCKHDDIVPSKFPLGMRRSRYVVRHFFKAHPQFMIDAVDQQIVKDFLVAASEKPCSYLYDKRKHNTSNRTSSQQAKVSLSQTKPTKTIKYESHEKEGRYFITSNNSLKLEWHEYIVHFKKIYNKCSTCQKSCYRMALEMVEHLFIVHYLEVIPGAFDTSKLDCQLCNEQEIVPSMRPPGKGRPRYLVRHFFKAHTQFMIDAVDQQVVKDFLVAASQKPCAYSHDRRREHKRLANFVAPSIELPPEHVHWHRTTNRLGGWRHDRLAFKEEEDDDNNDVLNAMLVDDEEEKPFWIDDNSQYEH